MLKKKNLIVKELFFLSILIFSFLSYNLYWIMNHSDTFSSEDMIAIGHGLKMYMDGYIARPIDAYFYMTQPVFPLALAAGMAVMPSPYLPFIIENLFIVLLAVSSYLIVKHINPRSSGVLAVAMILFSPGIIQYSRIIFGTIPCVAFFMAGFYCFLRSKAFKEPYWSMLWSLFMILSLLTRYIMLPYVLSLIFIGALSIAARFFSLKRKNTSQQFLRKNVIYFALSVMIISVFTIPHYLNEKNIKSSMREFSIIEESSDISASGRLLCETLNYPYLLINSQVGILFFMLFIISAFYIIRGFIHKKGNLAELQVLLLIFMVLFFYSYLAPLKNNVVTGPLVPFVLILVYGFLSRLKKNWKSLAGLIVIILLLLQVLPLPAIELFNPAKLFGHPDFNSLCSKDLAIYTFVYPVEPIVKTPHITVDNQALAYGSPSRYEEKLVNLVYINHSKKRILLLDLTTELDTSLSYYWWLKNRSSALIYYSCLDLKRWGKPKEGFDMFITSEDDFNETFFNHRRIYWHKDEIDFCKKQLSDYSTGHDKIASLGRFSIYSADRI